MGKIRILDEHVANQIAAGEVVERPASVVKELVENAIDAGSTQIDVTVVEGGIASIRVKDNGSGMDAADCRLAFERHATSKIRSGNDLSRIASLGFRGEALPSIAAVARVQLETSPDTSGLGYRIVVEGGKVTEEGETAAARGTDIIVRDLFYQTPARLKYLKSVQTELGHISDFMYRIAMAHPHISFTLRHQDNLLLQTLGNGDLLQVIAGIYGTVAAKNMLPVESDSPDFVLNGFAGKPELTRANRQAISFIVNGRYIRNHVLANALLRAYHTFLPVHRFPVAVLNLRMDPSLVDVNVHPAKLEVRFSKESELAVFVQEAVQKALHNHSLIPETVIRPRKEQSRPATVQEQLPLYRAETEARRISPPAAANHASRQEEVRRFMEGLRPAEEPLPPGSRLPPLYPIGQMRGTYIIAQNEDGLYLIDQHAAHERIHYELFYKKFGEQAQASQELAVPIVLEFTSAEAAVIRERLPLLEQAGVYLEHFGGNTFKVHACPHWLPAGEEKSILEEMAQWVIAQKQAPDIARLREKSAILCACRASVKANDSLSMQEMERLLDRLRETENPYTCPHGRPVIVSISNYELEKMFKRVM